MIINHDWRGFLCSQTLEILALMINAIGAVDHALVSQLRYKLKE